MASELVIRAAVASALVDLVEGSSRSYLERRAEELQEAVVEEAELWRDEGGGD